MSGATRWTVIVCFSCLAAGCSVEPLDPALRLAPNWSVEPAFNPQPEPPAQLLPFEATGQLTGIWVGRITSDAGGTLQVETLSSREDGRTIHLVQVWTLHPPDPVAPVTATLHGTLNLVTGRLVLNGRTAAGASVHVRGDVVVGAPGMSVGGELMFNPQPEPPALP